LSSDLLHLARTNAIFSAAQSPWSPGRYAFRALVLIILRDRQKDLNVVYSALPLSLAAASYGKAGGQGSIPGVRMNLFKAVFLFLSGTLRWVLHFAVRFSQLHPPALIYALFLRDFLEYSIKFSDGRRWLRQQVRRLFLLFRSAIFRSSAVEFPSSLTRSALRALVPIPSRDRQNNSDVVHAALPLSLAES
jgi:hypothetical protein